MTRRRRRSRGQSMVELALVIPILATLFLGAWTAADLIGDDNTAAQASRAGARYAAELGNNGYTAGGSNNPVSTDQLIINQMLPILTNKLTNATVTEIDIYQPNGCGGSSSFNAGTCPPNNGAYCCGEQLDKYTISGGVATLSGSAQYTLDKREQTHPNEAELGVRIVFSYTSPTLKMFNWTGITQYTVVRLAPEE